MNRLLNQPLRVRRWTLLVYWTLMFLGTHLPRIDRFGPDSLKLIPQFDKLVHAGMYGGWISICCWLLSSGGRRPSRAKIAWLFAGGAVYGALDELTQAYVARVPSLADYAADLCGMLLAIGIMRLIRNRRLARGAR
jgi:VanZ family protein